MSRPRLLAFVAAGFVVAGLLLGAAPSVEARGDNPAAIREIAASDLPRGGPRNPGADPTRRPVSPTTATASSSAIASSMLPPKPRGYYHEYTVKTPGARNRGARRIVCGGAVAHDARVLLLRRPLPVVPENPAMKLPDLPMRRDAGVHAWAGDARSAASRRRRGEAQVLRRSTCTASAARPRCSTALADGAQAARAFRQQLGCARRLPRGRATGSARTASRSCCATPTAIARRTRRTGKRFADILSEAAEYWRSGTSRSGSSLS